MIVRIILVLQPTQGLPSSDPLDFALELSGYKIGRNRKEESVNRNEM